MPRPGLGRATKQFLVTTTLHGFKYLCSESHCDRLCWVSWCAASACCAGALCAVLWARFLQVPALLALRSAAPAPAPLPAVAVCLPPLSAAYLLVGQLSRDEAVARVLTRTVGYILQGKATATATERDSLLLVDQLLNEHNLTILSALYDNMPPCREFAQKCRWQKRGVPCETLFHTKLTQYGVCCVMKSNKLKLPPEPVAVLDSSKQFRMVLNCSKPHVFFGCEFFTMYEGEESAIPVTLVPGSEYTALVTYTAVQDSDDEKLVSGSCVSSHSYSRGACMNTCMERHCGCSHPLRTLLEHEHEHERAAPPPPPCPLWQLHCLQTPENSSCNCLPSCRKISTDLSLEDNIMKSAEYTLDPLYADINVSSATVVRLRVSEAGSRVFTLQPTETWLTLLSSLGGVFNMFLGVGLFSALELLLFVLVRVPAAARAGPELPPPLTHVHARHGRVTVPTYY